MVFSKGFPPVLVAYHLILVPVADKFAMVEPEHKVCEVLAVGAEEPPAPPPIVKN